jgi:hypothetical protein
MDNDFPTFNFLHKNAGKAYQQLKKGGVFIYNRLRARNADGKRIHPKDCQSILAGATIAGQLSLRCQLFKEGWQFYCDSEDLVMLEDRKRRVAPTPSASGKKRRDDLDLTATLFPSKKREI